MDNRPGDARLPASVRAAFSARADGNVSFVVGDGGASTARAAVLGRVGATLDDAVFMQQVHGAKVATVGCEHAGRGARAHADGIPGTDAVVTFAPGVALAVLVADCVPVLLAHEDGIGAVHAGRRGVEHDVVGAAVRALGPERAREVVALVGPAIGPCCYEVPADLAAQVCALVPAARATSQWGTPALDLRAAVRSQLRQAGVEQVHDAGGCTRCGAKDWFSHRASNEGARAGRQMGVVVRVPPSHLPSSERSASYTGVG